MAITWNEIDPVDGYRRFEIHGLGPTMEHIVIHPNAWKDRETVYSLTDEPDVIEHIMWEHWARRQQNKNGMPPKVKANFDRMWGPDHKALRGIDYTPEELQVIESRHRQVRNPRQRPPQRIGQGG